jgi:hypothetical protein
MLGSMQVERWQIIASAGTLRRRPAHPEEEPQMAQQPKSGFSQRPKGKTPAERSAELTAASAKLKAEAAARREARAAAERDKTER